MPASSLACMSIQFWTSLGTSPKLFNWSHLEIPLGVPMRWQRHQAGVTVQTSAITLHYGRQGAAFLATAKIIIAILIIIANT